MRPSTSTSIHESCNGDKHYFSLIESMKACREAGFHAIDLNFDTAAHDNGPLTCDDNWKDWVLSIKEEIKYLGVLVPSCHAFFYLYDERTDRQEEMVKRSIEAAGIIGVPYIVIHPFSVSVADQYLREESLQDNIDVFRRYADIARPYGVKIAIENMVGTKEKPRFSSTPEDLLALVGKLNDPIFCICWDFGHGERSGNDTGEALRAVARYPKVVHVHDWTINKVGYDHTLPYFGQTDWNTVMPVLKEIGFDGTLNLEIQNYAKKLSKELRPEALKIAYSVACDLIKKSGNKLEN